VIEFWDGTAWTQQANPIPGGFGVLSAVDALSAKDAWAVGSHTSSVGALALHWDGSSWRQVPVPTPSGASTVSLNGVAVISPTDVWAVGDWGRGQTRSTLIEHWDGNSWTIVPSLPAYGRSGLSAVDGLSASSVWAVGSYRGHPVVLHWNGQRWKRVPSRTPPFAVLASLAAVGQKNVWAVGFYERFHRPYQTLTLRWSDQRWKRVPSPTPRTAGVLYDVAAVGRNDVWAVGSGSNGYGSRLLSEHWNGHSWRIVLAHSVQTDAAGLNFSSVAAVTGNDIWAAGFYQYPDGGCYYGVVYHWNGNSWSPTSTPDISDVQFSAIAAASPRAVWVLANYAEC
jgi:hypothetical protein